MPESSTNPAAPETAATPAATETAATPAANTTVADVVAALEAAYPPYLAESWDAVGLICGDPAEPADKVAFALDCTDAVVDAAIAQGAQMLVVHHPLLLRGVTAVPANSPKGRIVHKLIRHGIALFAAHTNADSARPGVNDRLAELLGITPGAALRPIPSGTDKWGFTVPLNDAPTVKSAIFSAGGGAQGDYEQACFEFSVTGQFLPTEGANPHLGAVGEVETVEEVRIEFVAPAAKREAIRAALIKAHPYEEPAYDCVETSLPTPADQQLGIGRVGELDTPMTLREFTARVAERLPRTEWGVRAAGDPDTMIRTVAVASGAGDSFLGQVAKMNVDCFVTSDLRHHPVDEHLRMGGCPVIDTAHWASEFPWCFQAEGVIKKATKAQTTVIDVRTDPWTVHEQ
ncbi:Nif3-like dinuclear metal center hexameric protein [Corynebacterium macclintockiae]|uniref:Nif3-like dinuclear metal center hexameric protein n=1 Tax=Corynebacterium macclintockiae TaxID=2913501 RepID=UPI003EC12558